MQSTKKKTRQGFFFVKLTNSMLLASGPNFFSQVDVAPEEFYKWLRAAGILPVIPSVKTMVCLKLGHSLKKFA